MLVFVQESSWEICRAFANNERLVRCLKTTPLFLSCFPLVYLLCIPQDLSASPGAYCFLMTSGTGPPLYACLRASDTWERFDQLGAIPLPSNSEAPDTVPEFFEQHQLFLQKADPFQGQVFGDVCFCLFPLLKSVESSEYHLHGKYTP